MKKKLKLQIKINIQKGYTEEFAEACMKQACKEVFNGKKANGVRIVDFSKCFVKFGMKNIKDSNEYKIVCI